MFNTLKRLTLGKQSMVSSVAPNVIAEVNTQLHFDECQLGPS